MATGTQAGAEKRQPEPQWRRRALAVAFLIAALSGPYLKSESRILTVWIDDSLSLATLENGKTRLETLFATLLRDIEEHEPAWEEITLRSLTNPGRARRYSAPNFSAIDADDWQAGLAPESAASAIPFLSDESSHWLLTDGASSHVQTWAQQATLHHVIQLGLQTENSAITRLAVRRALGEDDRLDVLVTIHNAGLDTDSRKVELRVGQQLLQTGDWTLLSGESFHWQTQAGNSGESISAVLTPHDFLRADDKLSVDLSGLQPVPVFVDTACTPSLLRALSTHPRLDIINVMSSASLLMRCQPDFAARQIRPIAQIRFVTGEAAPVSEQPTWFPYERVSNNLALSRDWLSSASWPDEIVRSKSNDILRAGTQSLLVVHNSGGGMPLIVDTVINMGHPLFTAQAEYAAFVATLVDLAIGRQLLDETISAGRDAGRSNIRPALVDARLVRSTPARKSSVRPISSVFLWAALLLLALDAGLLIRARMVRANA
jgi:hypothetical protein